jgi:hypothetical protein
VLDGNLYPDLVLVTVYPSWLAGRHMRAPRTAMLRWEATGMSWTTLQQQAQAWLLWLAQHSWVLANRAAVFTSSSMPHPSSW